MIKGIEQVEMHDGAYVTIKKYQDTTFGVFQCTVFYKSEDHLQSTTKRMRLSLRRNNFNSNFNHAQFLTMREYEITKVIASKRGTNSFLKL